MASDPRRHLQGVGAEAPSRGQAPRATTRALGEEAEGREEAGPQARSTRCQADADRGARSRPDECSSRGNGDPRLDPSRVARMCGCGRAHPAPLPTAGALALGEDRRGRRAPLPEHRGLRRARPRGRGPRLPRARCSSAERSRESATRFQTLSAQRPSAAHRQRATARPRRRPPSRGAPALRRRVPSSTRSASAA